jgi:hypothetical protein
MWRGSRVRGQRLSVRRANPGRVGTNVLSGSGPTVRAKTPTRFCQRQVKYMPGEAVSPGTERAGHDHSPVRIDCEAQ